MQDDCSAVVKDEFCQAIRAADDFKAVSAGEFALTVYEPLFIPQAPLGMWRVFPQDSQRGYMGDSGTGAAAWR